MELGTNMWIILLKDKDVETQTWGVSEEFAAVVWQVDDGSMCARISSNEVEGVASADKVSVVVIHDKLEPAFCQKLFERPSTDSKRVWIHFGSVNSDAPTFTRQDMARRQKERLSRLEALHNVPFNPFSMKSQTRWDRALQRLAATVRKVLDGEAPHKEELQERIKGLQDAWRWADGYYDATQPFGAWVRAVFPLFLDARGIELAQKRGADTDEWRREALEAYRKARSMMTSDLQLDGEEGLLARAEKDLNAAGSERRQELQSLFQDCRDASKLLKQLDEQVHMTFHIPEKRAQNLLALSTLLRTLEQYHA